MPQSVNSAQGVHKSRPAIQPRPQKTQQATSAKNSKPVVKSKTNPAKTKGGRINIVA